MKTFPDESIDMAMFSPPYWGLRDYGVDGQLGLESHPQQYIEHLAEGCREIKRILKKTGSMWINLGDTYCNVSSKGGIGEIRRTGKNDNVMLAQRRSTYQGEKSNWLQPKQKLLIPHRVAIALQDDGWILRNDAVWFKRNHMPSSVKDRLSNSFEFVFHFVKQRHYYYDLDAIRESHKTANELLTRKTKPFGKKGNRNYRNAPVTESYGGKFAGFGEEAEKYGSPRARNERYKTNNPHVMRDSPSEYVPLNPERPTDLSHPQGKNPGDILAYDSKYQLKQHGQTLQAFTREQSIVERRRQSRLEAEQLFPDDPKKQQEYINFIHDHDSHPMGKNPSDVIKIGMHHGSSLTKGRATHYEGQIIESNLLGKNPSDFWEVNTQPSNDYWCPNCKNFVKMRNMKCPICDTKVEAHFAVYPETLCELPIKATCPQWICQKCGKPRMRITKVLEHYTQQWGQRKSKPWFNDKREMPQKVIYESKVDTVGWSSCDCKAVFDNGIVLDPLCGSGTTLVVAQKLGRRWIGIDLNQTYVEMAKKRLSEIPKKITTFF